MSYESRQVFKVPRWGTRNVTRALFHELVRRLRLSGITAERVITEVESTYSELLSDADEVTKQDAVTPSGWA